MDLFGDDVIEEIEEDDDEEIIEEFVDTESFKHPREMNFLLGHADIEKKPAGFIQSRPDATCIGFYRSARHRQSNDGLPFRTVPAEKWPEG